MWSVIHDDVICALRKVGDSQFDSIVTDPPYGLAEDAPDKVILALTHWLTDDRAFVPDGKGFMGKAWDKFVPPPAAWDEAYRVLKPGGYLVAFAGTRTYDLMCLSIRLAGFEIRDSLHWVYGSGFPKSLDVSKAIDKAAGAEREVTGVRKYADGTSGHFSDADVYGAVKDGNQKLDTAPATGAARQWQGWGTALKPAHEPIVLARKSLAFKHTVSANVLEYGTGAINVDGCRVEAMDAFGGDRKMSSSGTTLGKHGSYEHDGWVPGNDAGRWPPNIVLTHSPWCDVGGECVDDCPVAEMDRQSGSSKSTNQPRRNTAQAHNQTASMGKSSGDWTTGGFNDSGGASRFFPVFKYNAKASKKERPVVEGISGHPTVKPLALIRWLVKLITPPGGTCLDMFAGTGTTAEACQLEGFNCILIENDPDSIRRIDKRMEKYEVDHGPENLSDM